MTTSITWDISKLNYMTEDQYVYSIEYIISAKDDKYPQYEAKNIETVDLKKPDTLIPYTDITKDTAIKWVKDRINELNTEDNIRNLNVTDKEVNTEATLKLDITPDKLSGIPWT